MGIRLGIAVTPLGDFLTSIEVPRGRPLDLWPRAQARAGDLRVREWRLFWGEITSLGPIAGSGETPLRVRFDEAARAGSAWTLHLAVAFELVGEATERWREAALDVRARP